MRIVPNVDVFLMYLWEEVSSKTCYFTILIGTPHILYYGLNVCVPEKFICWDPYVQCGGVRKRGF